MSQYRRFARMFEFDDANPGEDEHKARVRKVFDDHIEFNNPLDQVLHTLDVDTTQKGIPFSYVGFGYPKRERRGRHAGMTGPRIIQLFPKSIREDQWNRVVLHELGHMVGIHLLGQAPRSTRETESWAHAFASWVMTGMPEDHRVWKRLKPLLEEVVQ